MSLPGGILPGQWPSSHATVQSDRPKRCPNFDLSVEYAGFEDFWPSIRAKLF